MQCDLDEFNILEVRHGLSVRECQGWCADMAGCGWFTWYQAGADQTSLCLLLEHCDEMEHCAGCVTGGSSHGQQISS